MRPTITIAPVSNPGDQFDTLWHSMHADGIEDTGLNRGHYPYARRLRVGWTRTPSGWAYASEDDHLWEVFCAECGDTDGPADRQSPEVQRLRGPYESEHRAKHVADRHFSGG